MWRNQNTCALLMGCKIIESLWKMVWQFLRKLHIELLFGPVASLLGINSEAREVRTCTDISTPTFTTALFTIIKMQTTSCPLVNEWKNKTWHMHTMKYYSAFRSKEILTQSIT